MPAAKKTPRRIQDGPQRKRVPPSPTVLATLTPAEQRAIKTAATLVNTKDQELRVMRAGLNAIWLEIRQTYDLPESFRYDEATGNVTAHGR